MSEIPDDPLELNLEPLLCRQTVRELLDISMPTLDRWIRTGDFPQAAVRISNRRFWTARQYREYVADRLGQAQAGAE